MITQQTSGYGRQPTASRLVEIEPVPPLDVQGLLRVVWNGKWIIALATICCVLLAGYYAFRVAQPRYIASATLQIDLQPTALADVSGALPTPSTDIASLNTQIAVMKSNQLLGQVVHQLDLLEDPEFNRYLTPTSALSVVSLRGKLRNLLAGTDDIAPDESAVFEKTIQNLRGVIAIDQPRDTYIFRISAQSRSPDKATLIANALAAVYLMDQIHAKDAASQDAERWLTGRVDALQAQLQDQETAITGLISKAQIQEDAELDNLSNRVLAADQELDAARSALASIELATATTGTPRLQAEITRQQTGIASLIAQRDGLLAQLSVQSEGLVALHQLQRQADTTKVLYETFLTRLQETRIQRGLQNPDSRMIASATTGTYLGPRKTFILMISAVVGAMLGLACVTLRQTLRRGVMDAIQLRRETGLAVISQVPRSKCDNPRGTRKQLRNGRPVFGKAMQDLRTALSLSTKGQPPKTILLTSSIPNEGKTSYAIALAQSLGQSGKSVLLLGADPNSALLTSLGRHPKVGLNDVLNGGTILHEAISRPSNLPADLLHVGQMQPGDNVFLADGFKGLMGDLADRYDHIIVEAAPVLTSPQTQLLAQFAGYVVYCVGWSRTPMAVVCMGLDTLQAAQAPASGLILSQINTRKMARLGSSPYLNLQPILAAT